MDVAQGDVEVFKRLTGYPWRSFDPHPDNLLLVKDRYFYEYLASDVMFNLVNPHGGFKPPDWVDLVLPLDRTISSPHIPYSHPSAILVDVSLLLEPIATLFCGSHSFDCVSS